MNNERNHKADRDAVAASEMLTFLETDSGDIFKAKFSFRFWVRGGPPGPGYISELLEITTTDLNKPSISILSACVSTQFDELYDPPFLAVRHEAVMDSVLLVRFLKELLKSELFLKQFTSEKEPSVRDLLKETWKISAGKWMLEKTFYEEFPESLAKLRESAKQICKETMISGSRILLNDQKKQ